MKNNKINPSLILLMTSSFLLTVISYAETSPDANKLIFPPVEWISNNSYKEITIENGQSLPLVIQISVANAAAENAPGITIKNCGTTKRLNPGSSATCVSHDANNPVSFSSESQTEGVAGTYKIEVQK